MSSVNDKPFILIILSVPVHIAVFLFKLISTFLYFLPNLILRKTKVKKEEEKINSLDCSLNNKLTLFCCICFRVLLKKILKKMRN